MTCDIGVIIEGKGETLAVPVLLCRIAGADGRNPPGSRPEENDMTETETTPAATLHPMSPNFPNRTLWTGDNLALLSWPQLGQRGPELPGHRSTRGGGTAPPWSPRLSVQLDTRGTRSMVYLRARITQQETRCPGSF